MNKFVKGAKNLAFALSFVTVAACGNVKKADLEALEKNFNEKINQKADQNNCVSKSELSNLKSEIGVEVGEKIKSDVGGLEKKMVSLDVLDDVFVKDPAKFVEFFGGNVKLSEGVFKGSKIVLSGFAAGGKCCFKVKNGDKEIFKKGEAAVLTEADLGILKTFIGGGSEIVWEDAMCFVKGSGSDGVKFKDSMTFDVEKADELESLVVLLELGLLAKRSFENLRFCTWIIKSNNVGGKKILKTGKIMNEKLVNVLNRYEEGCCSCDTKGIVTFVGNKGWTSDGVNTKVVENVAITAE